MFVFLSKFLPPFIYPLGLVFLLILAGLVFYRRPRLARTAFILALVLLWLSATPWVAQGLARSLEWRYLPPDDLPAADVIVVLGGGTDSNQYPRTFTEINGAGDRVLHGARLYHQGKAPYILLTGGNITYIDSRLTTPAADMAELMGLLGVPADALWLQDRSRNTYEDALYSRQMLEEKGIRRVILVTSAMHMPRSVALFEHQGVEVIPAPTDYTITQARWDELARPSLATLAVSLVPQASQLNLTTVCLKEYIGMAAYRLRGWM